ncbi:hypothetical protein NECAME_06170 [Necator americanus]|uniref:Uncharacterized protein n=1 Tax=Necator americanus TaxID=51031 RepID=W2TXT8_NECAM|nr:hypothetical protein NECAME_06170 [Necator americanus]ETN85856.1 hypothetical protein NECAME_06170 [Necator americanus]
MFGKEDCATREMYIQKGRAVLNRNVAEFTEAKEGDGAVFTSLGIQQIARTSDDGSFSMRLLDSTAHLRVDAVFVDHLGGAINTSGYVDHFSRGLDVMCCVKDSPYFIETLTPLILSKSLT